MRIDGHRIPPPLEEEWFGLLAWLFMLGAVVYAGFVLVGVCIKAFFDSLSKVNA